MKIHPRLRHSIYLFLFSACALAGPPNVDWPAYHGGPDNLHYSSLSQINRDNIKQLQVAWTLDTADPVPGAEMYCSPLVVGGVLYVLSPKLNLIAANAATGKELWRFDPMDGKRVMGRPRVRGLMYWSDGKQARILFSARTYLYAVDARSGKPIAAFGKNGRIDLRENLDREPALQAIQMTTPGVIYKDLVIVGSTVGKLLPAAYGDIRAYDVRTGALRWKFHTIPRPGEFGYETWPKDAWKHTGGANSWSGMALDAKRGIVYVPTSAPAADLYGGDRAGDNLFSSSLVALDAATGKRLWHFQTAHHDVLDRDLPTPPTLVTVTRNGRRIDAVAQPTKTGLLFVLDRVTGKPLFPVEERKVPQDGALPGEVLSPTQPFPVKPEPFARQTFTKDLVTDRTPAARAAVLKKLEGMRYGAPFTPIGLQSTIMLPGTDGGAEWGGAAYDPETNLLYVNANDIPWYLSMKEREPEGTGGSGREVYLRECAACHGPERKGAGEFPSLVGIGERHDISEVTEFIFFGSGRMPSFSRLGYETVRAVATYLATGQDTVAAASTKASPPPYQLKYKLAGINKLQDDEGYPGIKPPWGTLNAIDLNTGEYAWRVPLGQYPALAAKGIKDTGSENYGGAIVTAGGLVFIGATVYDKKFRAFDKRTGKLLWETTLPASAHSTPAVYAINGRQFVVIAAGGGKAGAFGDAAGSLSGKDPKKDDDSGTSYIAFALPASAGKP